MRAVDELQGEDQAASSHSPKAIKFSAVDAHPILEDDRPKSGGHRGHLRSRVAINLKSVYRANRGSFGTHSCTAGPMKCASMAAAST